MIFRWFSQKNRVCAPNRPFSILSPSCPPLSELSPLLCSGSARHSYPSGRRFRPPTAVRGVSTACLFSRCHGLRTAAGTSDAAAIKQVPGKEATWRASMGLQTGKEVIRGVVQAARKAGRGSRRQSDGTRTARLPTSHSSPFLGTADASTRAAGCTLASGGCNGGGTKCCGCAARSVGPVATLLPSSMLPHGFSDLHLHELCASCPLLDAMVCDGVSCLCWRRDCCSSGEFSVSFCSSTSSGRRSRIGSACTSGASRRRGRAGARGVRAGGSRRLGRIQ
jgi:hypothetical protein